MKRDDRGLTRRLMLGAGAALTLAPLAARAAAHEVRLFVGTYTTAKSRGLVPLSYRPSQDKWTLGAPVQDIENASFGAYSRRFGLHYLAIEQAAGQIGAWRASPDGTIWSRQGEVSSGGAAPCFVSLDKAQSCLVAANYDSGSVAFFRLDPTSGLPLEPPTMLQDTGSGPNAERQAGPHAHWAGFGPDQRFLYWVDLGADEIAGAPFDPAKASLGERFTAYKPDPGSGPRHMVFHPRRPLAFLVSELGNEVTALQYLPNGRLARLQILSTLPADFTAHNQAAEIALNRAGTRLYVSNRGHDSLAVFAVGNSGRLKLIQLSPTLGDWPRFFLLLEDHARLIVANEKSGELAVFRLAPDGTVHTTGKKLQVPEAVYIGALS